MCSGSRTDALEERQDILGREGARLNEDGVDAARILLGIRGLHLPVLLQICSGYLIVFVGAFFFFWLGDGGVQVCVCVCVCVCVFVCMYNGASVNFIK